MRASWKSAAASTMIAAASAVILATAGPAAAETPQETIDRLQSQGYTVNIDRVGTAPLDQCVVTSVRNPQTVTQWVPVNGVGRHRDQRVFVEVVTSQSISVSLDCSRPSSPRSG